jgi:hypothetical protein
MSPGILPAREGHGLAFRGRRLRPTAGTVYTSPAWSMNVVYARLKPSGALKTILLNSILGFCRFGAWLVYWYSSRRLGNETTPRWNNQGKAA